MARVEHLGRGVQRAVAGIAAISLGCSGIVLAVAGPAGAASASICGAPQTATSSQLNSTTGISGKTVNVGNISIISGPVPGLFQGAADGTKAYFDYINSKGGVNGYKFSFHSYDDGFSGTQNQALAESSVKSNFADVGSFSLFDNYTCNVQAQNPAFANVSTTLDPGTAALPTTFSAQPLRQGSSLGAYHYLAKKFPKAVKHSANLVSNVDTAIAQWDGQKAAAEKEGFVFPYVREVSPVETNFTTDVVNMKNKGIQMVFMTDGDWQIFSALQKAMTQQNYHPQVVYSGGPIYDSHYIPAAGSGSNGTYLIQAFSLYQGEDAKNIPAVKTFDTWYAKVHAGSKPDLFAVYGWASAQMFVQAFKAAGSHPNRGSLLAQLKKITNFSASGLIAPSNPAKKIPANCQTFAQIQNGKFVRISPTKGGKSFSSNWDCSQPYYALHVGNLPKVGNN